MKAGEVVGKVGATERFANYLRDNYVPKSKFGVQFLDAQNNEAKAETAQDDQDKISLQMEKEIAQLKKERREL